MEEPKTCELAALWNSKGATKKHKKLGEGAPYRAQGPRKKSVKFAILPFWPIFGPACSPEVDE